MRVKNLLAMRNFWRAGKEPLHCGVSPQIMSCKCFESILRCTHLVDNSTLERKSLDLYHTEGSQAQSLMEKRT